jgi:hypothetical protein
LTPLSFKRDFEALKTRIVRVDSSLRQALIQRRFGLPMSFD